MYGYRRLWMALHIGIHVPQIPLGCVQYGVFPPRELILKTQ